MGRFVYDLLVPKDENSVPFQLKPLDGEVEKFEVCDAIGLGIGLQCLISIHCVLQLLPLDEVMNRMKAGLFKPNCAVGEPSPRRAPPSPSI